MPSARDTGVKSKDVTAPKEKPPPLAHNTGVKPAISKPPHRQGKSGRRVCVTLLGLILRKGARVVCVHQIPNSILLLINKSPKS